jgi:peptidyl-prolyl cis-trans isomerase D
MAKRTPMGGTTRKHRARAERERIQRRWILTSTIVTIVVVVGLLAYGWYDSRYIQPKIVMAEVNDSTITRAEFQGRIRLMQRQLLAQLNSYVQMESLFASDPNTLAQIRTLQTQIQQQLTNTELLGQQVINQMIMDKLVKQAAQERGLEVTQIEIDKRIEQDFGYYADGTPTPLPTFTPFPTLTPDITATTVAALTATPGPTATTAPTSTPRPTATAYTVDAFEQDYETFLGSLADFRIREVDYRAFVEATLYREKLREAFTPDISTEEEQVLVSQILVEDKDTGEEVLQRLEEGDDWADLVAEYSADFATPEGEGLLGWRTLDELLSTFGQAGVAAYGIPAGEVAGPFQSDFGWHIFKVDDREVRPLSEEALALAEQDAYDSYLNDLRAEADITINEEWVDHLPQPIAPAPTS